MDDRIRKLESFVYMPNISELGTLRPVMEKWTEVNQAYVEAKGDDVAYWFNERANVGLLAAAVWLSGGLALEEFSDRKQDEGGDWPGRVDLWFKWHRGEYVAEAKRRWVRIDEDTKETEIRDALKEGLADAKRDVLAASANDAQRVGLLFALPSISAQDEEEWVGFTARFLRVAEDIDIDFLAWFCPKGGKLPEEGEPPISGGRVYPGVALLGRVPRRSS